MNEQLKLWLAKLHAYMTSQEGEIGEDQIDDFISENPVPGDEESSPYQKIEDFYQRMQDDPEFRAQVMDKKNFSKFEKALGLAKDIVVTGVELSDAKEQIRAAELEESKLQKPVKPAPLAKNKKLQAALRQAELDLAGEDDAAFLSPYERQAQDQYAKDMAVAKTASTGQAGAYGALGQAASTRRLAGARQLTPLLAQKRQADKANMQDLIGQDISEDQFIKRSQLNQYGQDLGQYNVDRDLISKTGSAGMLNRAMSRRSLGTQIAESLGEPLYSALPMKTRNYLNPVMNSFKNNLS
jgi:hypothetical protein